MAYSVRHERVEMARCSPWSPCAARRVSLRHYSNYLSLKQLFPNLSAWNNNHFCLLRSKYYISEAFLSLLLMSYILPLWSSFCCCSVAQSCLTVWDPRAYSAPGFPALPISWSLLKLMSIKLVMPSSHLVLCHPLLLPSVFPSIRVFSNESALPIRWPRYWGFSFSISPSNESGLISHRID